LTVRITALPARQYWQPVGLWLAEPPARSCFPPILAPGSALVACESSKTVLAQPNLRLDPQSLTGC